jgi:hypothetical protein
MASEKRGAIMPSLPARIFSALGFDVSASIRAGRAVRKADVPKREREKVSLYRSKWEEDRANVLDLKKRAGLIRDARYEGITLELAGGRHYTADFAITENDGSITLEEVKGYWRHDSGSRQRFLEARATYPQYRFRVVTKRRGQWVEW